MANRTACYCGGVRTSGKCDRCDDQASSRKHKALYNTARWRRLRRRVWIRDKGICQLCGKPVVTGRWDADHKRDHGGDKLLFFDLDNVQVAHIDCHSRKTRA